MAKRRAASGRLEDADDLSGDRLSRACKDADTCLVPTLCVAADCMAALRPRVDTTRCAKLSFASATRSVVA